MLGWIAAIALGALLIGVSDLAAEFSIGNTDRLLNLLPLAGIVLGVAAAAAVSFVRWCFGARRSS